MSALLELTDKLPACSLNTFFIAIVVCVKLEGEEFANLNDRMGVAYANTVATTHVSTGESRQFYYSGVAGYENDTAAAGVTVLQSIKSITDNENAPATQVATAWTGCVGNFLSVVACVGQGRRNPRKHRRYTLTLITSADPTNNTLPTESETIEVPVVSQAASDILTCGQTLAALNGVYCIGYQGESFSRFHKLLS